MRLTTLIATVAILQVSANTFAQKVTLSQKNTSLEALFEKIGAQTGYDFLFTRSTLKDVGPISIEVKNMELGEVLKRIFADQSLEYSLVDKSIVVSQVKESKIKRSLPEKEEMQQRSVRGTVTDTTGAPLPGVHVQVKGAAAGTLTDENGRFGLSGVDENAVLVFSMLGHVTREVPVAGKTEVAIVLQSDLQALCNLPLTGYIQN